MRLRLLISYVSITALVLIVLEVPLGALFARTERRNLTSELLHDALALAAASEETLEGGAHGDLLALTKDYQSRTGARAVIVDRTGLAVADSAPPVSGERNFKSRPEFAAALEGKEVTGHRHSNTLGTDLLYVAVPAASGGKVYGAVRISYTTQALNAIVRRTWTVLALVGAGILVVVAAVSFVLARSLTRPILIVEEGAKAIEQGDLEERIVVAHGPSEIRSLAASFNAMAARLEHLIDSQRAFVAYASHQLRTPLAALRLRLENLEARGGPAQREAGAALDEVERLSRLVTGLLTLARAEEGIGAPEPVDAASIGTERLHVWKPAAVEKKVRLRLEGEGTVLATPGHLDQVLDNLISNALEVSPQRTEVTVSIVPNGRYTEIHVADEGPGMTPDERERAFDRFWRGRPGGSGLGLAIVRELVDQDGGVVELGDAPGGGLDVVVRLRTVRERTR